MPWIAVHEEVLGSKLRGLRKEVECSEAEALGILTVFWLWARKNADVDGLLGNADRKDVANAISPSLDGLDAKSVTEALIRHGWLDDVDGSLYVHDWYEWQQYWYGYLDKKERDKQRKRLERERRRAEAQEEPEPSEALPKPPAEIPPEQLPEVTPEEGLPVSESGKKAKKEKKPKPPKTQYAEFVQMLPSQYDKLVETYGKEFTDKLVEELDNYKGANDKTYKDDYRAILSWVVEKCEKKYPQLRKRLTSKSSQRTSGNPFADYK
nr:MAG TPA: replisome organizer [Caudoviricetes sp.]